MRCKEIETREISDRRKCIESAFAFYAAFFAGQSSSGSVRCSGPVCYWKILRSRKCCRSLHRNPGDSDHHQSDHWLHPGRYYSCGKIHWHERGRQSGKTIGTTISFFGLFSLGLTVLFLISIPLLLSLLQVPEASWQEAYDYIFICCLGTFFICEYNALSAVLRGWGDSVSPLVFVSIARVCNIAGDFLTVAGLDMGPAGTAIATVFSQGISMAGAVLYLNRKKFIFYFSLKTLRIHRGILKEIVHVGIPVSFQECIVRLSFLYLTSITNGFGVNAASAVGIASKYDVFAMLPATSAGNALAALTAQNLGAGKPERARKFLKYAAGAAFGCSLLFFAWAQLGPETMIGIFSADPQVIQAGIPFFRSCSLDYLAVALLFSLNGYLNGCEKTLFTMTNCCAGALLIRIPLLHFLTGQGIRQLQAYGLVSPCSSLVMIGVILLLPHLAGKKEKKPRFLCFVAPVIQKDKGQ